MNSYRNLAAASRMLFVSTLILLAVVGAACSGTVERRWSEEVDIGNGATVNIDRYSKFVESHSLSGDVYSVSDSDSTITFKRERRTTQVARTSGATRAVSR
jgi:hypothetical protein